MTLGNKLGTGNKITDPGETWEHYITKCVLHKLLIDAGKKSVIEYNLGDNIIDVAEILPDHTLFAYEVESTGIINAKKQEKMLLNAQVKDVKLVDIRGWKAHLPNFKARLQKVIG